MIKFKEFLWASKHFCMIVSPIPYKVICNPNGSDLLDGTDVLTLPAGAFSFDMWKLLPEKYFKNNPAFRIGIAYDDSQLAENEEVQLSYSDVDFGTGIAGIAGNTAQLAEMSHNLALLLQKTASASEIADAVNGGGLAKEVKDIGGDVFKIDENVSSIEDKTVGMAKDVASNVTTLTTLRDDLKSVLAKVASVAEISEVINERSLAGLVDDMTSDIDHMDDVLEEVALHVDDIVSYVSGSTLTVSSLSLGANVRYPAGTVFSFVGGSRYLVCLQSTILIVVGGSGNMTRYLALGKFCLWTQGVVEEVNAIEFLHGECNAIKG